MYANSVVAVCCSVLQCVAATHYNTLQQANDATPITRGVVHGFGEVGGWGRDPKKCTGRGVGLGSSTIFKKFNEPYAPS